MVEVKWDRDMKDKDTESAFNDFKETLRDTLTDIASLEVNSVLVSNISATHPSSDWKLLQETCEDLITWFEKNKTDKVVQQPLEDTSLESLKKNCEKLVPNKVPCKSGNALHTDVNECLKHESDYLSDVQCNMRSEYRRHLRYLQQYIEIYDRWYKDEEKTEKKKTEEKKLTSRDRQQLRKLWELVGVTCIYAQTVLELDGDIVSRINEQLFTTARDNAEELMHFHSRNVEAGSNYRNGLMDTFVQIIRAIIGK